MSPCRPAAGNSGHKAEGSRVFNGVITLCVVMAIRGDISLQMLASQESARPATTEVGAWGYNEGNLSHNEARQPQQH